MADLSKDTLLFAREYRRMCKSFDTCDTCGLHGRNCEFSIDTNSYEDDERILQYVQQWHDEHPLKTYAQDFREKFPKWGGIPPVCHAILYEGINAPCRCPRGEEMTCEMCWNSPMPEE